MNELLEILALGGLKLMLNGQPVTGLASRKAEALVLYLLHAGRPQARETVATLLWHDYPGERALNNLSVLLTSLRKQLGNYITITRQTVAFNPEHAHWLDATAMEEQLRPVLKLAQVEELLSRPAMAIMEDALSLYRGDFLAGFHVRRAQGFEEWALLERERLRHQVLEALDAMVVGYLARDEHQAGLAAARRLLTLDPLRERTHRQLMRLLVRSGQRNAALQQYESCRQLLAAELGIEAAEETTALYERIQAVKRVRRHNIPTRLAPFVGRQAELDQITERLAHPSCRLLTLLGPGGIGKTRLALEVAETQVGRHLHGVFFVPLIPGSTLVAAVADALELSLSGREPPKVQLLNYLHEKEMLLVLDGFELFMQEAPLLAELLHAAPEVTLLITTRQRLRLQAEWNFEVAGLAVPDTTDDPDVATSGSVQLFHQSALRVGVPANQLQDQLPAVIHICQAVEGMPLAIELAASWTRVLTCNEIAVEIEQGVDFLQTASSDLPERHRSLRAMFDHSWRLLTPNEQKVLPYLAVFRGGFERHAAREVAYVTLPLLSALVDKSLLSRRPLHAGEETIHYEMHDLLHNYAAESLAENRGEQDLMRARHCQYYATFLRDQLAPLRGPQPLPALVCIRQELGNVRQAWHWAAKMTDVKKVEMMIAPVHRFYWVYGRYQDGDDLFSAAVQNLSEKLHESNLELRRIISKLLTRQAWFCIRTGRLAQAQELCERSLELLRDLDAKPEIAYSLRTFGHVCQVKGDYKEAEQRYRKSLALSRALGDQRNIADCFSSWMKLQLLQGNFSAAKASLDESEAIFRQLDDRWKLALSRHDAGLYHMRLGAYGQAHVAFSEGLDICRELGSQRETAAFLHNMGVMAQRQGDFRDAGLYYKKALEVFHDVGDRRAIASGHHNLGEVAEFDGNYVEAARRQQASLVIYQQMGDQVRIATSLNALGFVALGQGAFDRADVRFLKALKMAWELDAQSVVIETLVGISALLAINGDVIRAIEILALVLSHPVTLPDIRKNRAEPLMAKLVNEYSVDVVATAKQRGRHRELEEVVQDILSH